MNELENYIKQSREAGLNDEAIKNELVQAGWSEEAIKDAFVPLPVPTPQLPSQTEPLSGRFRQIWKHRRYLQIGVVVVVVLGTAGYYAYNYFYAGSAERIWKVAQEKNSQLERGHIILEGSYTDTAPEDGSEDNESLLGDFAESITLAIKADGDFKLYPKGQAEVREQDLSLGGTVSAKFGSVTVSLDAEGKKIGNDVYFRVSGNPLLGLFGGIGGETASKSEWLKLSISEQLDNPFPLQISKKQIEEAQAAFDLVKLVRPVALLGSEKLGDTETWHFTATLDKTELKRYLESISGIFHGEENLRDYIAQLDKLDMRKIEVWIGRLDKSVHQVEIETSFPSLIFASLKTSRNQSRDARRLGDIRQIMTGLELFFNDNARYPASSNGAIDYADGNQKFSTYMANIPTAPVPADGGCSDQENTYRYEQLQGGQNYRLSFCVGKAINGFEPGILEGSSGGIKYVRPASGGSGGGTPEVPDIPFTATLKLKINLSNLNGNVKIEPPSDALDYTQLQNSQKELNNVRNISYQLQNYYYANQRYPDRLSDLAFSSGNYRVYSSQAISKPVNNTGDCAGIDENFNYRPVNNYADYVLEFCLTAPIKNYSGDYARGKHQMTSKGIDGKKLY